MILEVLPDARQVVHHVDAVTREIVPDGAIQRAEEVLMGLGYRSARPGVEGEPGPRGGKYAYPILTSSDGLVHVDLHRHLLPEAPFDVGRIWEHARRSSEAAHLVPDHEDLLLHVAAHFFKDRIRMSAGSLGQLADLSWTVQTASVDWDEVVLRAAAYHIQGQVFLAFMALNELIAELVPTEALVRLRPAAWSQATGRAFVKRRLLGEAPWALPGYFGRRPGSAFSRRRRPLRRILPDRAYLARSHGPQPAGRRTSYTRMVLLRARSASSRMRPWHAYEHHRLSRWMRSMAEVPPDDEAGRRSVERA